MEHHEQLALQMNTAVDNAPTGGNAVGVTLDGADDASTNSLVNLLVYLINKCFNAGKLAMHR